MKYITLIIGLLVVGCGKKQPADTNEGGNTPAKSAKESALEGKVVGAWILGGGTLGKSDKLVFHKGGTWKFWENGRKPKYPLRVKRWSIKDNEVHADEAQEDGDVLVFRLNDNGNLEWFASIEDGKREDAGYGQPPSYQTYKKIK